MTNLRAVVVDALDPAAQAGFWAAALDWKPIETTARSPNGGISLLFVPAVEPKAHKNRLHLDLAGGADQAAEVQRLLDLGATRADIGQGDVGWEVLADPEGNEFCVLPETGTDGNLAALCQDAIDPAVQAPFWTAATGWNVVAQGEWGVALRAAAEDGTPVGPRLVMGPPAAPKNGVNRLRFAVGTASDGHVALSELLGPSLPADPEGNEYHLLG